MAYRGADDTGFKNDFTERFARMVQQPSASQLPPLMESVLRADRRDEPTRDERIESNLSKAIQAGGEGSIVGYVDSVADKIRTMSNLLRSGQENFQKVQTMYDDLVAVSSDNQQALTELSRLGAMRGPLAQKLGKSAEALRSGAFNDAPVTLADGTQTTLGMMFGGGGYMANRNKQFSRLDYSPRATQAYLGEDPDKSSIVGEFFRPSTEGRKPGDDSPHEYHLQLSEAANYLTDNYDDLVSTFGVNGTRRLASAVKNGYLKSGGMTDLMEAVRGYAKKFAPNGLGDSGEDFVNNLFTSADKLASAAFWNPSTGKPDAMNDSDRRFLTISMISAMKAIPADLGPLDFRDRRVQSAVTRMADVFNRTRSEGGDLFSQARAAGRDLTSEMADYMRAFITNSDLTPDNAIASEEAARRMYTMRIIGSPDAVPVADVKTGSRAQYASDAANYLGSRSSSRSVDWTMKNVIGDILSMTRPLRLSGKMDEADAFTAILSDPDKGAELEARVRKRFETMLGGTGRGGRIAAAQMASSLLNTLSSPTASDVFSPVRFAEGAILRGIQNPNDPEDKELVDAMRVWHLTNVSDKDRFTRERERIVNLKTSVFGGPKPLSREEADLAANTVIQAVTRAERSGNGGLARQLLANAASIGWDYEPVPALDKNGNPVPGKFDQIRYEGGKPENRLVPKARDVSAYLRDPTSQATQDYLMRKAVFERQQKALGKQKLDKDE